MSERAEGHLTVRLDPLTDPERTASLRLAVAVLAHRLLRASPGASWGPSSLGEAVTLVELAGGDASAP